MGTGLRTALSAILGLGVALGMGFGAYTITRGTLGSGVVRIRANLVESTESPGGPGATPGSPARMVVELEGVLLAVDTSSTPPTITVGTRTGEVRVKVPENAVIQREDARIALADLVPGERVEVKAEEINGELVAWKVEAKGLPGTPSPEPTETRRGERVGGPSPMPTSARVRDVEGWVTSVSGDRVSIALEHGGSFTFRVDSSTRWEHASGPGDLRQGQKIEAYLVWTGSEWLASKVEVKEEVRSSAPSPGHEEEHASPSPSPTTGDDHSDGHDHHGDDDD